MRAQYMNKMVVKMPNRDILKYNSQKCVRIYFLKGKRKPLWGEGVVHGSWS